LRQLIFLLVHGAGETPAVWEGWEGNAIDLQAGLNVDAASMLNYEAVVTCDAVLLPRPFCVVGRGLGALAAMMAARRVVPEALVLVEPWPPAEAGGLPDGVVPEMARPESPLALAECRRGISVPSLEPPTLVVGSSRLAELYGAEELSGGPDLPYAVSAWARSASAPAT
jgi:hypothetical protein